VVGYFVGVLVGSKRKLRRNPKKSHGKKIGRDKKKKYDKRNKSAEKQTENEKEFVVESGPYFTEFGDSDEDNIDTDYEKICRDKTVACEAEVAAAAATEAEVVSEAVAVGPNVHHFNFDDD